MHAVTSNAVKNEISGGSISKKTFQFNRQTVTFRTGIKLIFEMQILAVALLG
jgi:hypothetical protein